MVTMVLTECQELRETVVTLVWMEETELREKAAYLDVPVILLED